MRKRQFTCAIALIWVGIASPEVALSNPQTVAAETCQLIRIPYVSKPQFTSHYEVRVAGSKINDYPTRNLLNAVARVARLVEEEKCKPIPPGAEDTHVCHIAKVESEGKSHFEFFIGAGRVYIGPGTGIVKGDFIDPRSTEGYTEDSLVIIGNTLVEAGICKDLKVHL